MRNSIRSFLVLLTALALSASPASALTLLKNEEARQYIGDIKTHILAGQYVYGILSRSHRDAMHGRFSDGVIFNPGGGHILFLRNKDGERKFVINAPEGREKEPVTEETWRQKIQNTLSDDNPIPYVFFDDAKREIAIVFVGKGTEVITRVNEKNLLEIELKIEGSREHQSNRRLRY